MCVCSCHTAERSTVFCARDACLSHAICLSVCLFMHMHRQCYTRVCVCVNHAHPVCGTARLGTKQTHLSLHSFSFCLSPYLRCSLWFCWRVFVVSEMWFHRHFTFPRIYTPSLDALPCVCVCLCWGSVLPWSIIHLPPVYHSLDGKRFTHTHTHSHAV